MRRLMFLVLALMPAFSSAQAPPPCPCAPWSDNDRYFALIISHNLFGGPGAWLDWMCYPQVIPEGSLQAPPGHRCTIAQPWGAIDLRKLGDRIETIRSSTNPDAAFAASWKRHVTLPLEDPSLTQMREAINRALMTP